MITHKVRNHDQAGRRSKAEMNRALRRIRRDGTCKTTKLARFGDFGAVVAAALLASPETGPVRLVRCEHCGGWHFTRYRKGPQ